MADLLRIKYLEADLDKVEFLNSPNQSQKVLLTFSSNRMPSLIYKKMLGLLTKVFPHHKCFKMLLYHPCAARDLLVSSQVGLPMDMEKLEMNLIS